MKKAIIVDLDGTLSDPSERRHYVESQPKDFDKFYQELIYDNPNSWCEEIVRAFSDRGYTILYVTGRPNNYRRPTMDWLEAWDMPKGRLFMRDAWDYRPDFIIKEEIFNRIKETFKILFAIDDRKQVVDMWRSKGIVCLQCDDGNF